MYLIFHQITKKTTGSSSHHQIVNRQQHGEHGDIYAGFPLFWTNKIP